MTPKEASTIKARKTSTESAASPQPLAERAEELKELEELDKQREAGREQ